VLRAGLTIGAVPIPLQIVAGDMHGLITLKHQPAKVAAMEGVWQTERGAPLLLFAWPDEKARENRFEIGVPNMAAPQRLPQCRGCAQPPARGSAVLCLSSHGRHRHADAGVLVYLSLIVAYVSVVRDMAEKPVEIPTVPGTLSDPTMAPPPAHSAGAAT